jgi:hypothetical protein
MRSPPAKDQYLGKLGGDLRGFVQIDQLYNQNDIKG